MEISIEISESQILHLNFIIKYSQFQSVGLSSDVKYFSGHFVIMIIIFSSLLQSFVVVFLFRKYGSPEAQTCSAVKGQETFIVSTLFTALLAPILFGVNVNPQFLHF